MNILQVCTAFGCGGIGRHAVDLGLWLRRHDHVVYFAGSPGENMDVTRDNGYLPLEIEQVSSGNNIYVRVIHVIKSAIELRHFLKKNKIEIIHCHESAAAIVVGIATIGISTPILLTYHGSEPERIRGFSRVGKLTADQIITPSYRSAADLIGLGGLEKSKVRVIGLGVKNHPNVKAEKIISLRKKLLRNNAKHLIVVIARIEYQKGIDILIKVVKKLSQHRQDFQIVVVGDGSLLNKMKALSKSTQVDHLIQFIGFSDQPYTYLQASDLFLLTSRWEALPISIVEAFRAGLPVVAADTSGVEELVDSSVGGVVPIGNIERFTLTILRILDDDPLRAKMSTSALKRSAEDRFSPDYIHKIFEKNYESILGD